ncbi:MAG: hypothetical protein EXX96DRAFT_541338 [Benjaminiella poitrasii]|nr:MAG: hypothetical protein EXX96DRAFT_541338 [Benjaminiella poitrasii]
MDTDMKESSKKYVNLTSPSSSGSNLDYECEGFYTRDSDHDSVRIDEEQDYNEVSTDSDGSEAYVQLQQQSSSHTSDIIIQDEGEENIIPNTVQSTTITTTSENIKHLSLSSADDNEAHSSEVTNDDYCPLPAIVLPSPQYSSTSVNAAHSNADESAATRGLKSDRSNSSATSQQGFHQNCTHHRHSSSNDHHYPFESIISVKLKIYSKREAEDDEFQQEERQRKKKRKIFSQSIRLHHQNESDVIIEDNSDPTNNRHIRIKLKRRKRLLSTQQESENTRDEFTQTPQATTATMIEYSSVLRVILTVALLAATIAFIGLAFYLTDCAYTHKKNNYSFRL